MPSAADFQVLSLRDYRVCQLLERSLPDEAAASACAYFIQQAVEKALKGIILLHGETPEFTHDIRKLTERCTKVGIQVPDEFDDIVDSLTLWESRTRYDPYVSFSQKRYEKAKSLYSWAADEQAQVMQQVEQPSEQRGVAGYVAQHTFVDDTFSKDEEQR